jgi:rare lipoprotein A (RlpA)-like double-psi beta-barrel protein
MGPGLECGKCSPSFHFPDLAPNRGPVKGRKIDLSDAAAGKIGITKKGVAKVKIVVTRPRRKPLLAASVR